MIKKEFDGLIWHEFELLEKLPLIHATFTRHGGFSQGALQSLNVGNRRGDDPELVKRNMSKIVQTLQLPPLVSAKLCHGSSIEKIASMEASLPICDGLSTQNCDFGLMITHADCQAAIIYDPMQHAIAAVHCGWRGNVQNIYREAILHMQQTYGSKANNLLICISPSLGPENSEFINYRTELPTSFCAFQFKPLYFDFWKISEQQLLEQGILPHHIQIAGIDTYASPDHFSHRRSKECGRQATICALGIVKK